MPKHRSISLSYFGARRRLAFDVPHSGAPTAHQVVRRPQATGTAAGTYARSNEARHSFLNHRRAVSLRVSSFCTCQGGGKRPLSPGCDEVNVSNIVPERIWLSLLVADGFSSFSPT